VIGLVTIKELIIIAPIKIAANTSIAAMRLNAKEYVDGV